MLAVLDLDKKIRMEVDVLDYAIRGVLSIECKDRKWQPVIFLSKSLNETERNYEIYDKEILKIVFTIPEGLFEPTMMFFGLTNSPATFQTMINEILWDLINTRKVASFIDNIIIKMNGEERHE